MPNPNFPAELGNIPYSAVIGGPLNAAVRANARASMTAAKFIQDVGFQSTEGDSAWQSPDKPIYVTFHYKKEVLDDNGNASVEEFDMKVPLLLMLNIPYFEVSNVTIDFHVKLNSIQTFATSSKFNINSSVKGEFGWFLGNVNWKVNTSYQSQTRHSQKIERTYDQNVHVLAESVEPPEGVHQLFGVLEQTITETAKNGTGGSSGSSGGTSGT